jgi:hypothetical protein
MTLPISGRRYQIDYMSGLRYVFSPAYRAGTGNTRGRSPGLRMLYIYGGLISMTAVISVLLFLPLATQGLFQ